MTDRDGTVMTAASPAQDVDDLIFLDQSGPQVSQR